MWEKKVAPLTGVAFAVLWIASSVVTTESFEFMPPASDIAEFFVSDSVRIMTGSYIGLLAAFALLWFSGSMYASVRRIDDDSGRLAVITLSGGVFASAMLAVGYLATYAAAERAWVHDVADPGATAALADLTALIVGNGAPLGFAALIGASAIAALRLENQPRRAAVASLILAVGLISPYAWAVIAIVIIWVPVAAVWIYRAEKARDMVSVA